MTHGCSNLSSFSIPLPPYGGSNGSAVTCVVKTAEEKWDLSVSFTDQSSISGLERPNFKVEQYLPSNAVTLSSVEGIGESKTQDQSAHPAVTMPTVPPATHPPHFHETTPSKGTNELVVWEGRDSVSEVKWECRGIRESRK